MNRSVLPLGLIVMDGWGEAPASRWNAVTGANPEHILALRAAYPSTLIKTSGPAVGLPPGQIGNSEVGHLCLGAGRIVLTDLERINREIESGIFAANEALLGAARAAKAAGGAVHLMGLFSDGGVHSHIAHLAALVNLMSKLGIARVFVHAFLDGRDTPPQSAIGFMRAFEQTMGTGPSVAAGSRSRSTPVPANLGTIGGTLAKNPPGAISRADGGIGSGFARIASVIGRFYAMDRDTRWERVEAAYKALVHGEGFKARSGVEAIEAAYARGETDEFVKPTVVTDGSGRALGPLRDGDAVIFFNFRADRARELTRALTFESFDSFDRGSRPKLSSYVCFGTYDRTFPLPVAFPNELPHRIFGEIVSEAGLRQLRIAETEKYAHVTFFFNGGREQPFEKEERVLIPSPRIATYDLQPEMSAPEVTASLLEHLRNRSIDVFLLNFANADMVGHSGIYEAAVRACKEVDRCVGAIAKEILAQNGALIVTADHGNSEQMWDFETNSPHTAHTTNPVPLVFAGAALKGRTLRAGGVLADVTPTLLEVLELPQPKEMTGKSLLVR